MKRTTRLACALSLMLAASAAGAQEKLSLRLDYSIYGTHAPLYYGVDKGLYKAEGIDLRIGEGSGSSNTAKLVAQNIDPIGFMDYGTMLKGVAAGMPLKAIFAVHQRSPMVIISHTDAPVRSPKELEGKVLGMSASESTAQMFPVLAALNGVDQKKINVIAPAVGTKTALFLQRRADAITGVTYFHIPPLEAQGAKVHYFSYADFGVNALEGGLAANTQWLAANPETARRFVRATRKAYEAAQADPAASVDALVRQRPEQARNRELLLRQLQLSLQASGTPNTKGLPFGVSSEKDWQAMVDQFVQSNQIERPIPTGTLYTNDYNGD
ncbi:sulfonate ABC transporter substrate-binding protein [Achromobacter denitrificans]|uniref:ABC transporter substrate-binding protein n=1 Tax=Achromobacter denitrificans TaxID=32002 RepID=UPI0016690381|nr:ABC transporter substrate-binding protein [Achromobacter denitrificans]MDF3860913.1 ABC transporter substrate-binding protein [Achromobacter denitrificans]GFN26555.1 sulfonate ABC transporter substrate-binding protein [Achromobacter denitrificans]